MNDCFICENVYAYIRTFTSIKLDDWFRMPAKYDPSLLHQNDSVEKYFARLKNDATLILSAQTVDSDNYAFVMEVEFDNEKGVFYEINVRERDQERVFSEYAYLFERIRARQEKKFIDRLNSALGCQ